MFERGPVGVIEQALREAANFGRDVAGRPLGRPPGFPLCPFTNGIVPRLFFAEPRERVIAAISSHRRPQRRARSSVPQAGRTRAQPVSDPLPGLRS